MHKEFFGVEEEFAEKYVKAVEKAKSKPRHHYIDFNWFDDTIQDKVLNEFFPRYLGIKLRESEKEGIKRSGIFMILDMPFSALKEDAKKSGKGIKFVVTLRSRSKTSEALVLSCRTKTSGMDDNHDKMRGHDIPMVQGIVSPSGGYSPSGDTYKAVMGEISRQFYDAVEAVFRKT